MRRLQLKDSDLIYKIVGDPMERAILIAYLKNSYIYVFTNDTEDALITYEPAYGMVPWYNTHTWSLSSARGKALKEFFWDTGIWILENTPCECITCVCTSRLGMFLSHIKAKRRFQIGDYTMYTFDHEQLREVKECHKDLQ